MAKDSSSNVASVAIVVIVLIIAVGVYFVVTNSGDGGGDIEIDLPDVDIDGSIDPSRSPGEPEPQLAGLWPSAAGANHVA